MSYGMRRDSLPHILASIVLVLALFPPALADKAPALDSTRFHLVKVKHRLKQSQRPHWSHRAPGTKRQTAVQGLLCSFGVVAACDGSSGPAIDTATDPQNCGSIGNVCPSSLPNSVGAVGCQAGHCVSSCALGYSWDFSTSSCINTATDPRNCGSVGRVCSTPSGVANVACLAGYCLATSCTSGYSYRGGSCAVVPFATDSNNCGRPGLVCPAAFENGRGSVCDDGQCKAEMCDEGYEWDGEAGECARAEREDGCSCREDETCFAGVCLSLEPSRTSSTFSNEDPSSSSPSPTFPSSDTPPTSTPILSDASASVDPPSFDLAPPPTLDDALEPPPAAALAADPAPLRTRQRRAFLDPSMSHDQLCPEPLTACLIAGSASLATASDAPRRGDPRTVAELLRAFAAEMSASRGGYECIDVRDEVDSCGGCVTLGEGRDCTRDVPHATSTGCEDGACVVFACERGWRPDGQGRTCVRSEGRGGRKHGKGSTARRGHR